MNPCYINDTNIEKPLLVIFTCRDVAPEEELCFSYFGDSDSIEVDEGNISDKVSNFSTGDVLMSFLRIILQRNDGVYKKCECGARNCRGKMFGLDA